MEQNILEGNKLIAEFMGMEVSETGLCKPYPKVPTEYFKSHNFDEWSVGGHPYNSSWDWLMPVVEKIEADLITNVGIFGDECKIVPVYDIQFHHQGPSKIEATYATVIDYITWYNTQTEQQ